MYGEKRNLAKQRERNIEKRKKANGGNGEIWKQLAMRRRNNGGIIINNLEWHRSIISGESSLAAIGENQRRAQARQALGVAWRNESG